MCNHDIIVFLIMQSCFNVHYDGIVTRLSVLRTGAADAQALTMCFVLIENERHVAATMLDMLNPRETPSPGGVVS